MKWCFYNLLSKISLQNWTFYGLISKKSGLKSACFGYLSCVIIQWSGIIAELRMPSLLFWTELTRRLISQGGVRRESGAHSSISHIFPLPQAFKIVKKCTFQGSANRKLIFKTYPYLGDCKEHHIKLAQNLAGFEFFIHSVCA